MKMHPRGALLSHRFSGGKVVAPATKGGAAFPSPVRAVVKVLSKEGSYNILTSGYSGRQLSGMSPEVFSVLSADVPTA